MRVGKPGWPVRTAWPGGTALFASILVISAAVWALMSDAEPPAADQWQVAAEIEAEDAMVCQHLGMPMGSPGFADCAARLQQVRQRHEERLQQGSGSLL